MINVKSNPIQLLLNPNPSNIYDQYNETINNRLLIPYEKIDP